MRIQTLPARLQMNFMARPGVSKIDFELLCTEVSAIHGCGRCLQSHTKQLLKEGVSRETIQSAVRIAAVVVSAAAAIAIEDQAPRA